MIARDCSRRWRTTLIVRELEQEIEALTRGRAHRARLKVRALENGKDGWHGSQGADYGAQGSAQRVCMCLWNDDGSVGWGAGLLTDAPINPQYAIWTRMRHVLAATTPWPPCCARRAKPYMVGH